MCVAFNVYVSILLCGFNPSDLKSTKPATRGALWRILLKHIQLGGLTYWQYIVGISGRCCYSTFWSFMHFFKMPQF